MRLFAVNARWKRLSQLSLVHVLWVTKKQISYLQNLLFLEFPNTDCKICKVHAPLREKGLCSQCRPPALTLNRQVSAFLDFW